GGDVPVGVVRGGGGVRGSEQADIERAEHIVVGRHQHSALPVGGDGGGAVDVVANLRSGRGVTDWKFGEMDHKRQNVDTGQRILERCIGDADDKIEAVNILDVLRGHSPPAVVVGEGVGIGI